ncbi:hypothetical protein OQG75_17825 [Acinetobacter baumannii]|nr:hypothetical protein [Acinetobacter baumannii]MCW8558353.1 hypothetical protein [Acinetobacter baumannii]MCW8610058.1 hypothetical protein [Acinetobacter baumannii]MCW8699999.1 hypothetical protein [Acinetobacter baumannii]MCW8707453.1 hypothetical protein [Acinetobacter baumannii]
MSFLIHAGAVISGMAVNGDIHRGFNANCNIMLAAWIADFPVYNAVGQFFAMQGLV